MLAYALFFRKFDVEYLEEMKGIADGAAKAAFKGRPVDLLDIVTLNSAVDMSPWRMASPTRRTPSAGAPS